MLLDVKTHANYQAFYVTKAGPMNISSVSETVYLGKFGHLIFIFSPLVSFLFFMIGNSKGIVNWCKGIVQCNEGIVK